MARITSGNPANTVVQGETTEGGKSYQILEQKASDFTNFYNYDPLDTTPPFAINERHRSLENMRHGDCYGTSPTARCLIFEGYDDTATCARQTAKRSVYPGQSMTTRCSLATGAT